MSMAGMTLGVSNQALEQSGTHGDRLHLFCSTSKDKGFIIERYGHTMTYHQHLQSKNHGNDGNHGDRTGWSFVNFAAKPSLRTIPKGSKGTMGRSGTAASCATRFQAMLFFSYRFHRHDVAKNDQQWNTMVHDVYIYIIYIYYVYSYIIHIHAYPILPAIVV